MADSELKLSAYNNLNHFVGREPIRFDLRNGRLIFNIYLPIPTEYSEQLGQTIILPSFKPWSLLTLDQKHDLIDSVPAHCVRQIELRAQNNQLRTAV
jgi:hypothetical protein